MPITELQRQERRNNIGSSDMAAIMGLDPYRNAHDVWLEKTGRLSEDTTKKPHLIRGNYLEAAILDWFGDFIAKPIECNVHKSKMTDTGIVLASNLDAVIVEDGTPVEAKSIGAYSNEKWGAEQTDDIPDRVVIQCQFQLICTDKDICYVPTYLPYRDFQYFIVEKNAVLIKVILESAQSFWSKVKADTPPDNIPNIDVIKRIRRRPPGESMPVPQHLVDDYLEAKKAVKIAGIKEEETKSAILSALDGAAEGYTETGQLVTNYIQTREAYSVKETEYPVLRLPQN